MRYVSRNTPFVVRGGATNWTATKTWNLAQLENLLRDHTVNVAVTPKGFVNSPLSFLSSRFVGQRQLRSRAPRKSPLYHHTRPNHCLYTVRNADAPIRDGKGELVFAKPWEEDQPFSDFVQYVARQETDTSFPQGSEIRYAQTRKYERCLIQHCRPRPRRALITSVQKMTTSATSTFPCLIRSSVTYPLHGLRCRKSPMPSTCGESQHRRGLYIRLYT